MKKGYFITLEGPDGGGKSTQIELTTRFLQEKGYDVVCTREPGGTLSAEKIRAIVLDPDTPIYSLTETLLYLAARAEHIQGLIAPALEQGKVVICDRYSDSTLVYQGLVRGLGLEKVKALNDLVVDGLTPDLTILLDAEPNRLLLRRDTRGVTDRFENEGLAFQEKVRDGFVTLAKLEPERIKVVDALQGQAEVQEVIQKLVLELFK